MDGLDAAGEPFGRRRDSGLAGERRQCGFFSIENLEDPADFGDFENDFRTGLEAAEFDGSAVGVLKLQDRHQGAESGRIDMFHFLQIEQNEFEYEKEYGKDILALPKLVNEEYKNKNLTA